MVFCARIGAVTTEGFLGWKRHWGNSIIIVMMRYGGAVDQIAEELGYSEQELVEYIKSSGIDKQLSRRSWKWKAGKKRIRNVI